MPAAGGGAFLAAGWWCFSGGAFPLERGLQRSFREKAFVWFFLGERFWLLAGRMSLEKIGRAHV